MKKCLFPIYAYMVSCAQRSKNLERYLMYLLTERNFLDEATDWRGGRSVVAPAALGNCVLCKDSINRHQSFPTTFCRPTNLVPRATKLGTNSYKYVVVYTFLHSHTSSNSDTSLLQPLRPFYAPPKKAVHDAKRLYV